MHHLDAALLAIYAQPKLVEMAARPAAGMHHAEGAVGEVERHGEAVIGVELIFADAVSWRLVEGAQPAEDMVDVERCAIAGEIEDVDADVAQHAVRAVAARQPPEPFRVGAPVAPEFRHQPALQIGGLDMAYRADLARLHHLARLLERRDIAIGEVHHIDDAGGFRRIGHLARLAEILGQRLYMILARPES